MIIRKYGIELHRLKESDIELIRTMRNRQDIQKRMFEQEYISKEKQQQWFKQINNIHNYFFIIRHQDKPIGLIQGKNQDFSKKENEGGVYIWEQSLIGKGVAAKASICFIEASFNILLNERIYARVRPDNPTARKYNYLLGYKDYPELGKDFMVLTRESWIEKAPFLRKIASEGKTTPPLSIEDIDIYYTEDQRHLYKGLPDEILRVLRPRLPESQENNK